MLFTTFLTKPFSLGVNKWSDLTIGISAASVYELVCFFFFRKTTKSLAILFINVTFLGLGCCHRLLNCFWVQMLTCVSYWCCSTTSIFHSHSTLLPLGHWLLIHTLFSSLSLALAHPLSLRRIHFGCRPLFVLRARERNVSILGQNTFITVINWL